MPDCGTSSSAVRVEHHLRFSDPDGYANGYANCDTNSYAYGHTDSDTDFNTNSDTDFNTNSYAHGHADRNTDSDPDTCMPLLRV
jgi:hypothetical protein